MLSALTVVVNAQADARWSGAGETSWRPSVAWSNKPIATTQVGDQHRPPQTKPTTWDHSATKPTLPYPHIPGLSPGFLYRAPGTILDMPCC